MATSTTTTIMDMDMANVHIHVYVHVHVHVNNGMTLPRRSPDGAFPYGAGHRQTGRYRAKGATTWRRVQHTKPSTHILCPPYLVVSFKYERVFGQVGCWSLAHSRVGNLLGQGQSSKRGVHTVKYILSTCSYLAGNITVAPEKHAILGFVGQRLVKE